ncbi:hypothetical protein SAY87_019754 [Trapa incisa]|uniref:ABC transporter domain-containing protein n=1 Tax=Trapa incisa TaxID=236973 RepID=A0AAN7K695_9MYRT|nr:hypothetical protein SAY87_019754 [Trapa incisa]
MQEFGDGEDSTSVNGLPSPGSPEAAAPRDLTAIMSSSSPITLKFVDVCYRLKVEESSGKQGNGLRRILSTGHTGGASAGIEERTVLHGITGLASPGEILAVLGPSGSGKSTLLNALAGRLHGRGFTGTILANGLPLGRSTVRRTGFVTQDDVLYPHLTVRETLVFCALLRLPMTLTRPEKAAAAEAAITELGLSKCADTIIGNSFIRGVSGGERKRVCIAHEMLMNPSLLILDEPTSGLDSTAAHRLLVTLEAVAQRGRTVVMSVHQPSSRIYQMFRSVLVLSEGRCLYYGKGNEALPYFDSLGFSPAFPMNPADFLLDLANGACKIDGMNQRETPNIKQRLAVSFNTLIAPRIKAASTETAVVQEKEGGFLLEHRTSNINRMMGLRKWFNQFSVLMQRSLKERKYETFNNLRVFQVMAAAVLGGLMWWHSDFRDIQDRLGLLFFISIFWGVFPSFNSVFTFPQDRAVFTKERASGMYSLSSYFMARIVGDMPMELILPTIFLSVAYWMTGLRAEVGAFLMTLLVLLGYVLVSQGLGLFMGAAIMDAKQASTVVTVTMLAFVLTGGFYVHKVPSCLAWTKYTSTTFYSYRLLIHIQYGEGKRISSILGCSHGGSFNPNCKFVEEDMMGQISPTFSLGVMLLMFFGYRLLAYLVLRRIRT